LVDGSLESPCRVLVKCNSFLSLTVEALQGKKCQNSLPSGGGRSFGAKISGGRVVSDIAIFVLKRDVKVQLTNSGGRGRPPANILIPLKRRLRYNYAAEIFYIMKLCSRRFVLYCRNCPKDDKFRYFIAILRKLGAM